MATKELTRNEQIQHRLQGLTEGSLVVARVEVEDEAWPDGVITIVRVYLSSESNTDWDVDEAARLRRTVWARTSELMGIGEQFRVLYHDADEDMLEVRS
ncbi:hypothetical protein AXF14_01865 [Actinomyces radicidentis]|uniref:Uncharacterized protein n=1 Tax=Actinomyces radicidentis TaxID=111015 RepID=A0A0X8JCW0_ACTRD|nr:hypothetical protein [Actinomyces radicidentis]AMD86575.1 hypothetical protein AXF14_01865 [Actinomyces radicidentis]